MFSKCTEPINTYIAHLIPLLKGGVESTKEEKERKKTSLSPAVETLAQLRWAELRTHQALLDEQAEENSISHFPQVLEAYSFQLCILHNVLQLVVEEL